MGPDHYLSKIERNTIVLDKAPEELRSEIRANILWARDLSKRLELLDYSEREKAIAHLHEVLDSDYEKMGFDIESSRKM